MPTYQLPGNSEDPTRKEINDPYADFKKSKTAAHQQRNGAHDANKSYPSLTQLKNKGVVASTSTAQKLDTFIMWIIFIHSMFI